MRTPPGRHLEQPLPRLPRCRHGHTSASPSAAPRTTYAYIRETRLLARMPLLHARLTQRDTLRDAQTTGNPPTASRTRADQKPALRPEEVIDQLRRSAQNPTYHHPTKALEAGGKPPIRFTV